MALIFNLLNALSALIVVDALLSWVQRPGEAPRRYLMQITEPIYAPIRRVISPQQTGGVDLSPLIILLVIRALRSAL